MPKYTRLVDHTRQVIYPTCLYPVLRAEWSPYCNEATVTPVRYDNTEATKSKIHIFGNGDISCVVEPVLMVAHVGEPQELLSAIDVDVLRHIKTATNLVGERLLLESTSERTREIQRKMNSVFLQVHCDTRNSSDSGCHLRFKCP